jgi:hypothetical protein
MEWKKKNNSNNNNSKSLWLEYLPVAFPITRLSTTTTQTQTSQETLSLYLELQATRTLPTYYHPEQTMCVANV